MCGGCRSHAVYARKCTQVILPLCVAAVCVCVPALPLLRVLAGYRGNGARIYIFISGVARGDRRPSGTQLFGAVGKGVGRLCGGRRQHGLVAKGLPLRGKQLRVIYLVSCTTHSLCAPLLKLGARKESRHRTPEFTKVARVLIGTWCRLGYRRRMCMYSTSTSLIHQRTKLIQKAKRREEKFAP